MEMPFLRDPAVFATPVAIKPDSLSLDEAVAIPFGANAALHFIGASGPSDPLRCSWPSTLARQ